MAQCVSSCGRGSGCRGLAPEALLLPGLLLAGEAMQQHKACRCRRVRAPCSQPLVPASRNSTAGSSSGSSSTQSLLCGSVAGCRWCFASEVLTWGVKGVRPLAQSELRGRAAGSLRRRACFLCPARSSENALQRLALALSCGAWTGSSAGEGATFLCSSSACSRC